MTDGEFNDISRAIGALEAGLQAHDQRTLERHKENIVRFQEIEKKLDELSTFKWKITGIASGAGTVAAFVAPWLKKLIGLAP